MFDRSHIYLHCTPDFFGYDKHSKKRGSEPALCIVR